MIKVLIVDDSAFMRKLISEIVNSSDKLTTVGKAKNGKEALQMIETLKPDVITMDVEMPVMNGQVALEKIMASNPLPVVMLSSVTKEGADSTMRALDAGAVDFITKPESIFKVKEEEIQNDIIDKIIIASKVNVKKNSYLEDVKKSITLKKVNEIRKVKKGKLSKIIAIGTSTGGPRALQHVIPKIPGDINAAILVVQHMPPGFTKSLSERLNNISELEVKESEGNEELLPGVVYIAPGDKHLKIKKTGTKFFTYLDDGNLVSGHKPSVDALFNSINENGIKNAIGVIMTGMGKDGAKEMKTLRDNENYTIAQDEESCVVFGMPKSAIGIGAVSEVVELDKIASSIIKAMEV
ncbi:chemotaxis response regulator protein-glutamate methylesterase [Clostridiaceae bacterium HSG29]|nr:chemotaxis response regulator protein-glutamate methylesterase [Clostridiaceae bacterium HSG29]